MSVLGIKSARSLMSADIVTTPWKYFGLERRQAMSPTADECLRNRKRSNDPDTPNAFGGMCALKCWIALSFVSPVARVTDSQSKNSSDNQARAKRS